MANGVNGLTLGLAVNCAQGVTKLEIDYATNHPRLLGEETASKTRQNHSHAILSFVQEVRHNLWA